VTENKYGTLEENDALIEKLINEKELEIHLSACLAELKPEKKYSFSDKGNGELFSDAFKYWCRYNTTAKEWYVYNGKVWSEDTGAMVVSRRAKKLADALLKYTIDITDNTLREAYQKHVVKLGQLRNREIMIKDARDKFYITNEDLDKDLYLFNCQNGVIDLRNFTFREHSANDMLSRISNVNYNPEAKSPLFEKFMNDIMKGDADKIRYLQKLLGYSMTGDTREEACYLLYGATTRNGKGTLVETYSHMMGKEKGYSLNMKPESLAQKKNNDSRQANGDIARLDGCRFLNVSEPPKKMIFDVALLKTLLGRDTLTTRHLYQREFEFIPCFKLIINTNYLPVVNDDTLFSSGRLVVITFDKHFCPEERDKGLKDKLRQQENINGMFNWCLDGLKMYYTEGLKQSKAIIDATAEYRTNSDKIGNFISECLEKSDKNSKAKDVYDAYQHWCSGNGYGTENKGNFLAELKSRGMLAPTGTVFGVTYRNVIKGYVIDDWIHSESNPYV
jgi:putative DNA primase/helicase